MSRDTPQRVGLSRDGAADAQSPRCCQFQRDWHVTASLTQPFPQLPGDSRSDTPSDLGASLSASLRPSPDLRQRPSARATASTQNTGPGCPASPAEGAHRARSAARRCGVDAAPGAAEWGQKPAPSDSVPALHPLPRGPPAPRAYFRTERLLTRPPLQSWQCRNSQIAAGLLGKGRAMHGAHFAVGSCNIWSLWRISHVVF